MEELKDGVIYICNNTPNKIKKIGESWLQIHDGIVRDLTKVQYILDMKKNPILLGVLVCKGLHINLTEACLKTMEGAYVVMKSI